MNVNPGHNTWHSSDDNTVDKKQQIVNYTNLKRDELVEALQQRIITMPAKENTKSHFIFALCADDLENNKNITSSWDDYNDKSGKKRHAEENRKSQIEMLLRNVMKCSEIDIHLRVLDQLGNGIDRDRQESANKIHDNNMLYASRAKMYLKDGNISQGEKDACLRSVAEAARRAGKEFSGDLFGFDTANRAMNERAHAMLNKHDRWNAMGYGIRFAKISNLEDLVSENRQDNLKNFNSLLHVTERISSGSPDAQFSLLAAPPNDNTAINDTLNDHTVEKELAATDSTINQQFKPDPKDTSSMIKPHPSNKSSTIPDTSNGHSEEGEPVGDTELTPTNKPSSKRKTSVLPKPPAKKSKFKPKNIRRRQAEGQLPQPPVGELDGNPCVEES